MVICWTSAFGIGTFKLLKHYQLLRVDQATELAGIDNFEHGGPAYPEFCLAMASADTNTSAQGGTRMQGELTHQGVSPLTAANLSHHDATPGGQRQSFGSGGGMVQTMAMHPHSAHEPAAVRRTGPWAGGQEVHIAVASGIHPSDIVVNPSGLPR